MAAVALAALNVTAIGANAWSGRPSWLMSSRNPPQALPCRSASCPTQVPRRLGRQLRYARNTGYFAQASRGFVASGATLVADAAAPPRHTSGPSCTR